MNNQSKKLLSGITIVIVFFLYFISLRIIPTKTNRFQDAIQNGEIDNALELLKKNGGLANQKTAFSFTPLQIALSDCNTRMVKILIEYGADVNLKGGRHETPPIISAVRGNCFRAAEILIDNGADVNGKNMLGERALIIAVKKGERNMVMALVNGGADVNVTWKKKRALHYAKEKGDSEIIRILENNGVL